MTTANAILVSEESLNVLSNAGVQPNEMLNKAAFALRHVGDRPFEPSTWIPGARVLILSADQYDAIQAVYLGKSAATFFDELAEQVRRELLSPRLVGVTNSIRETLTRRAVSPHLIAQAEDAVKVMTDHPDARMRLEGDASGCSVYISFGGSSMTSVAFHASVLSWLQLLGIVVPASGVGAIYAANKYDGPLSDAARIAYDEIVSKGDRAILSHAEDGIFLQWPGSATGITDASRSANFLRAMNAPSAPVTPKFDEAVVDELTRVGALRITSNTRSLLMLAPTPAEMVTA